MPRQLHENGMDLVLLRRRLMDWHRRNRRDLPWRHRPGEPYAQWLAEMMLQQTQTAAVIPYYLRFLKRFPTVVKLAEADRADVLNLWAGLGYYRRAHLLHDAARKVAFEYGGTFPVDVQGLLALPGVGRYTAGAIASIAFDRRAPILDGNVARVLARLFRIPEPPQEAATQATLWRLAEEILPQRGCGRFNEALMDLGATVCTPKRPACPECPLAGLCCARHAGEVETIPAPRRRPAVRQVDAAAVVVDAGGYVLLRRRPDAGLWAGMWEIPFEENGGSCPNGLADRLLPAGVANHLVGLEAIGEVEHRLTHRALRFRVYRARTRRVRVPRGYRWATAEDEMHLPSAFRKILRLHRG